ncbi:MAG: NADAR family protein [Spirochaetota bacterium]
MKVLQLTFQRKQTQWVKENFAPFLLQHSKIPAVTPIKGDTVAVLLHPRVASIEQLPTQLQDSLQEQEIQVEMQQETRLNRLEEENLWVVQFFSKSKACVALEIGLPDTWKQVLSNFYRSDVVIEKRRYATVEHYFQSQKALCSSRPEMFDWFHTDSSSPNHIPADPLLAKQAGARKSYTTHGAVLDFNLWLEKRVAVMENAIQERYIQDKLFQQVLQSTKGLLLWHFERSGAKSFWGGSINPKTLERKGKNQLGQILMNCRDS